MKEEVRLEGAIHALRFVRDGMYVQLAAKGSRVSSTSDDGLRSEPTYLEDDLAAGIIIAPRLNDLEVLLIQRTPNWRYPGRLDGSRMMGGRPSSASTFSAFRCSPRIIFPSEAQAADCKWLIDLPIASTMTMKRNGANTKL